MFELGLIQKYLRPKRKQLSVSIISFISILVIALVVWLVLVFLSVTNGMEKKWTEKLIALTAPMQILPTEAYYQSDFYLIDGITSQSDYTYKTIEEKKRAKSFYDSMSDEPYDPHWIPTYGKDLVSEVFESIYETKGLEGLSSSDFEVSVASARFRLLRSSKSSDYGPYSNQQSFLSQISYLSSFDSNNPRLLKILLKPSMEDLTNLFSLLGSSNKNVQQEQPTQDLLVAPSTFHQRLKSFLKYIEITHLKVGASGYLISRDFFPKQGKLKAILTPSNTLIIPESMSSLQRLSKKFKESDRYFEVVGIDLSDNKVYMEHRSLPLEQFQLQIPPDTLLPTKLILSSIRAASFPGQLKFSLDAKIQNLPLMGSVPFQNLEIGAAKVQDTFDKLPDAPPFYCYRIHHKNFTELVLPEDLQVGEGVLLPKSFREQGMLLGDRGFFSYQSQTASTLQEMRIPIFVAGFYDPGLIPNGGKIILTPKKIISSINASIQVKDSLIGNGINVWFNDLSKADQLKKDLLLSFKEKGIDKFWQIKTYREYEFSKDFLEQISSDKTIFSLVAILIIIVACTNIISMLILLVQQKRREIGIMEAMGASKRSIAFIFGGCGLLIGLLSSFLGTLAAYLTLKNIRFLMDLISKIQGHQAFNPAFFGDALPSELNFEAFRFVMIATLSLSLLAGLIPALKAMRLNTTDILRSEQ